MINFRKRFFLIIVTFGLLLAVGACDFEEKQVSFGSSLSYSSEMYEGSVQKVTINVNNQVIDLSEATITWYSLTPNVATISNEGIVYAMSSGKAQFRVTISDGTNTNELNFEVTVLVPAYVITYQLDGGTNDVANPNGYSRKDLPLQLKEPTKAGYEFKGWLLGGEVVTEIPANQIGNIELVATWEAKELTITYDLQGGEHEAGYPTTFTVESEDVALKEATKEGYNFKGWELDGQVVTSIPKGTVDNVSLVATWEAKELTITYDLQGGEHEEGYPTTFTVESEDVALKGATKANHVFKGWKLDGQVVTSIPKGTTDSVSLVAEWEKVIVESSITFVLEGGSFASDAEVPTKYVEGEGLATLPEPTRENYTFLGWYVGEVKWENIPVDHTGTVTLTAKWEEQVNEYTVTFELEGGAFAEGVVVPTKYVEGEGLATLPEPTRENYTFLGWYVGEVKWENIPVDHTGTVTLTAKWVEASSEYDITYQLNGGEWVDNTIENWEDFVSVFLKDTLDYIKQVNPETKITEILEVEDKPAEGEWYVRDYMGVTYKESDFMEAFFKTDPVYSVKWGWMVNYCTSKGANLSSTALLRSNVHSLIYRSEYTKWPYSENYSSEIYENIASYMPAGSVQKGPEKYTVGQVVEIPGLVREGYEFVGWTLNGVAFAGITAETTGNLELVAVWKRETGNIQTLEVGPDSEYKTLAEALAVAEEGAIIKLAAGEYEGANITVKGVTIEGPNAGIDPNTGTRGAEAVITTELRVSADSVTINGVVIKTSSIVANPTVSVSDLTISYIIVREFASPSSTNAPIMLLPNDNDITYRNFVLENSLFEKISGRAMILYGSRVENISVLNNRFLGTSSATQYNDAIKLNASTTADGSTVPAFDVRGKVEFIGNYFQDYMQYVIWLAKYGTGTYDILNNTFKDCCLYPQYNEGAVTMATYVQTAGEKAVINVQFNTADNSQILARLQNAGATAENWEAHVNYNKIFKNTHEQYVTNRGTNELQLIDATNNYYDKTPTSSFFAGVSAWEPYYANEDDVPVYGQDVNVFDIEYVLNEGILSDGAVKKYDTNVGVETLPTPTREGYVFLGWYVGEVLTSSIAKGTVGKVTLEAKWREDALYVGSSQESYYYATITEALAVAKQGDKIIIDAGTYNENITISVADLVIVGPNANINPNTGERVAEAIITGTVTVSTSAENLTIQGLAFTGAAKLVGAQVINFNFVNNYAYDTDAATMTWVEGNGYTQGFIYFAASSGKESRNLVFTNNKFDNVSDANVNIAYSYNVSFHGNVFNNFDRDAIRFNNGGYNYGVLAFTNNEFTQDTLGGYNGIYFRIYGGPGIDDTIILIEGNIFENIGNTSAGLYSGAISARNYQELGAQIIIRGNDFIKCHNFIRIRNNGTAANHAKSNWSCEIVNNNFIGIPATNYFANWNATDGATTNPINTTFGENYYEDNDGSAITDLSSYDGKFLNVLTKGTAAAARYTLAEVEQVEFWTITYELNGGSVEGGLVYAYNRFTGEITLPSPEKTNHQFRGWYVNSLKVTSISAESTGNLHLVAEFDVLEGEVYTITYVFDTGDWQTRDAKNRQEIVDALFTDYYNWAVKYNKYTGTYEAFCKGADGTYQSGYWYTDINAKMRNPASMAMDETGTNDYFWNTPEYYYKWRQFFLEFQTAMYAVNSSQNFFTDTYAAMIRVYQFADWTATGANYFTSYLPAFYKAVQIPTEPDTSYRGGQELVLKELVIDNGLIFLGWYDNPEFTGEAITKIETTDTGNKIFYARWSAETLATEIIVSNEVTEIRRFETLQLQWSFNPADTTDQRVEFSSSNPEVLNVSSTGLLTAIGTGTVTITIKALGGSKLVKEMTIDVYAPDHFEISYETESYVVEKGKITLNAEYIKRDNSASVLVWSSLNDDIATVDGNGVVTGVKAGVATIRVSVQGSDAYQDMVVTVVTEETATSLSQVLSAHESNIFTKYELGIGAGTPVYYSDIFGSVSKFLYENLTIDDQYLAAGNANTANHGSAKTSTEFITVHYTGNMRAGAGSSANASYFVGNADVSIHYVTGNDGVYHCLDDNLVAWHAGDSGGGTFAWLKTGVKVGENDPKWPVFGLTENSKFSINGVETIITAPNGNADRNPASINPTDSKWINDMGLAFRIVEGEYEMGTTWWCHSQIYEGRICSNGGNRNSIGIESAVDLGSDLWYTWQKTAQLVAKLMLDNNLDITRVVGHHFYSAKDCPQPLLENDMEIWWEFIALVEHEYELLTTYKDYGFEFSTTSSIVDDNGRIIEQPEFAQTVTYTVKVTVGGVDQEITLASAINGIYSKVCPTC